MVYEEVTCLEEVFLWVKSVSPLPEPEEKARRRSQFREKSRGV